MNSNLNFYEFSNWFFWLELLLLSFGLSFAQQTCDDVIEIQLEWLKINVSSQIQCETVIDVCVCFALLKKISQSSQSWASVVLSPFHMNS